MTLPSSGAMTMQDINVEMQKSATTAFTLNDTDVRALAGKTSGGYSLTDLYGKAFLSFDFQEGAYDTTTSGSTTAIFTLTASKAVVWTYTVSGSAYNTSITSGTSATSIRMQVTPQPSGAYYASRTATWNVTATVDGKSYHWNITCTAEGNL